MAALAAQAAIIPVTDPSELAINDAVSWSQFADGSILGPTFSAVSDGGRSIGGSFAGTAAPTGFICDAGYSTCGNALYNYSLWSSDGSDGAGPVTITFAGGVSGVGTYLQSTYAAWYTDFSVMLELYNGATLLGTVTADSDEYGSPVYIGARSTGAAITSAVFSLASIGKPYQAPTSAYFSYNYTAGHTDPGFCASLSTEQLAFVSNRLQCPQKTFLTPYAFPFTVQNPTPDQLQSRPNISIQTYGGHEDTVDEDPSHLADFYMDTLDLVASSSATPVPEPGSFLLLLAGMGVLIWRRSAAC